MFRRQQPSSQICGRAFPATLGLPLRGATWRALHNRNWQKRRCRSPGTRQTGDTKGEIAEYHEALRLNPKYAEPHVNLCAALLKQEQVEAALEECETAIQLKPDM